MADPANPTGAPSSNSPFHQPINPEAQRLAGQPPKEVSRVAAPKPATSEAQAWAEMSPNQRAEHSRAAADVGRTSQSVHTRTPDGRPLIDGKLPDGTIYQPGTETAPVDSAAPANAGEKVKIGDVELTAEEWAAAASHKAESDLRATQIPATAADYKLELPADLKLPDGIAATIVDPADPVMGSAVTAATEWAAKNKLTQAQFSEMLALHAASRVNEHVDFQNRQRAEFEALGTAGPVRADAVTRWLVANFGSAARPLIATMVTKSHIEVYEGIISKLTSQGAGNFHGGGRVEEPRGVDPAIYDSWSYSQKKEYAERAGSPGNRR